MASSDTTRLLVLGVARLFEPANGYQLRRELLSWQVDSWAHVNPGSIYSMLTTLTTQGMLERHDLESSNGGRPVAVYRSTAAGQAELVSLVRAGLRAIQPFDQTEMYAALSLCVSLLSRSEVTELLEERLSRLDGFIEATRADQRTNASDGFSPPHVAVMMGIPLAYYRAEKAWLVDFLASIGRGEFLFSDDDWSTWHPRRDDPAMRMVAERAEYERRLSAL